MQLRQHTEAQRLLRETHLTVGEVAQRIGVSDPAIFRTQFQEVAGLSPEDFQQQYKRRKRHCDGAGKPVRKQPLNEKSIPGIEEAKRLLTTTDLPIKDIAKAVGFPSHSYFSQEFSRAEGISPKEYRLSHRTTFSASQLAHS